MRILFSDTSVVLDLERGALIDDLFRLPYEFAVPDLLFVRELAGALGDRLLASGLRVEELSSDELRRAVDLRRDRKDLSAPETFAFAIAERRSWPLLAGDGGTRRLARDTKVECYSVSWVWDQFEAQRHVPIARLHAGLTAISIHPRCRLPEAEISARLERYRLAQNSGVDPRIL